MDTCWLIVGPAGNFSWEQVQLCIKLYWNEGGMRLLNSMGKVWGNVQGQINIAFL